MKKLMPLMVLALIVLIGCAKEDMTPAALSTENQNVENIIFSTVNLETGDMISHPSISADDLATYANTYITTRSNNNAHANGHFSTQGGTTVSGSAQQNNNGVNGHINLSGDNWSVQVDCNCLIVVENEAILGGQITAVTGDPGNALWAVGNYFYSKAIDHGEGNNEPSDQYAELGLLTNYDACGALNINTIPPLGGIPWSLFGISEVANESDQIQIND